jgi:hypothetical protein
MANSHVQTIDNNNIIIAENYQQNDSMDKQFLFIPLSFSAILWLIKNDLLGKKFNKPKYNIKTNQICATIIDSPVQH